MTTRLTALGRQALQAAQAAGGELRREHTPGPGSDRWPANANTLAALVRHGHLEHGQRRNRKGALLTVWRITDAGRAALNPPPRAAKDTVRSLRAKGKAQSMVLVGGVFTPVAFPEPEPVDPRLLRPDWQRNARERHERDKPTTRRKAA